MWPFSNPPHLRYFALWHSGAMLCAFGSRSRRAFASAAGRGFSSTTAASAQTSCAESGSEDTKRSEPKTSALSIGIYTSYRTTLLPFSAQYGAAAISPVSMHSKGFAKLPFKLPSGVMPKKPPPKLKSDDDFANLHNDNKQIPQGSE